MSFEVYRSSNNIKRRPDDSLVESECARFKASDKDFGIISLDTIHRWMTINPSLQWEFHLDEKSALKQMEEFKERSKDVINAEFIDVKEEQQSPPETTMSSESYITDDGEAKVITEEIITGSPQQKQSINIEIPEEITEAISLLKDLVPDKWPGRTPTLSLLEPSGGIWTTTKSRAVSGMQPIYCPTVRFDVDPPQLYYQLHKDLYDETKPSKDAATHAFFYAGLEFIGAALTIPYRVEDKENINIVTNDDMVMLNDLSVADYLLGRILEDNAWTDHSKPFVAALSRVNSVLLFTDFEQLQDCLKSSFFVSCD